MRLKRLSFAVKFGAWLEIKQKSVCVMLTDAFFGSKAFYLIDVASVADF